MKPAPFEYCRPDTLDEALTLLTEFGDDALVMSGGLSLGALLNMRMVRPEAVIDINRIAQLSQIEVVRRNPNRCIGPASGCSRFARLPSGRPAPHRRIEECRPLPNT